MVSRHDSSPTQQLSMVCAGTPEINDISVRWRETEYGQSGHWAPARQPGEIADPGFDLGETPTSHATEPDEDACYTLCQEVWIPVGADWCVREFSDGGGGRAASAWTMLNEPSSASQRSRVCAFRN
jgi:hypothetical protein